MCTINQSHLLLVLIIEQCVYFIYDSANESRQKHNDTNLWLLFLLLANSFSVFNLHDCSHIYELNLLGDCWNLQISIHLSNFQSISVDAFESKPNFILRKTVSQKSPVLWCFNCDTISTRGFYLFANAFYFQIFVNIRLKIDNRNRAKFV